MDKEGDTKQQIQEVRREVTNVSIYFGSHELNRIF